MNLELRSVRIKNCGPIDDIKIAFFDASGKTLPVCVIGGANGTGKTTVLEVIASLWETIGGKENENSILGRADYAKGDFIVNGEPFSIVWEEKEKEVKFFLNSNESEGSYFVRGLKRGGEIVREVRPGQSRLSFVTPILSLSSIIYFPHYRSIEPVEGTQINKEEYAFQFVHRFETIKHFPGSLDSYLIWLDYAEPEIYQGIIKFLNELNFDGKTFHVNRKELAVLVKTKDGHEHKLHELSSGEQNLLIILIELRRRLESGDIVMIDEI